MMKCDPITRTQCPHGAYCESFAVYADESECAKFNQKILNRPMTNGERIRAMGDEELADYLMDVSMGLLMDKQIMNVKAWLGEPVKEANMRHIRDFEDKQESGLLEED